jgi:DNA-binding LytR/AlgR family response regulator
MITKYKIFIVEDMAISRMALESILEENNYEIVGSAAKAENAYMQLQNLDIDLLLIDINLAGEKDGVWLTNKMRETSNVPIIFLTAYSDTKTLDNVKNTKSNGYLMKPYNIPTLLTTIAIVLQNHKGRYKEVLNIPEFISDNHIFIKEGSQLKRVKTKDIFYIMSDANYLHINTAQKNYLVRNKLLDFYTELPDKEFIQVHRRFLINKHHVDSFDTKSVVVNNKTISISKSFRNAFLNEIYL